MTEEEAKHKEWVSEYQRMMTEYRRLKDGTLAFRFPLYDEYYGFNIPGNWSPWYVYYQPSWIKRIINRMLNIFIP